MKIYTKGGFLGRVQSTRARSTGTQVSIFNNEQAGFCQEGGPWATFCEDHGEIINHSTLTLARSFTSCPEEWCETCQLKSN